MMQDRAKATINH